MNEIAGLLIGIAPVTIHSSAVQCAAGIETSCGRGLYTTVPPERWGR